jgi:hypothetical protein
VAPTRESGVRTSSSSLWTHGRTAETPPVAVPYAECRQAGRRVEPHHAPATQSALPCRLPGAPPPSRASLLGPAAVPKSARHRPSCHFSPRARRAAPEPERVVAGLQFCCRLLLSQARPRLILFVHVRTLPAPPSTPPHHRRAAGRCRRHPGTAAAGRTETCRCKHPARPPPVQSSPIIGQG